MNAMMIAQLILAALPTVLQVEQMATDNSMSGTDKLAYVTNLASAAAPTLITNPDTLAKFQAGISAFVAIANAFGTFKKTAATATTAVAAA